MGAKAHVSWPFQAALAGAVTTPARRIDGGGLRCDQRTDRLNGLLGFSPQSHRGTGRTLTRALVGRPVLVDGDFQKICEIDRVGVGQPDVGAFDPSKRGGGDLGGGGQLGLRQSFDHAPVPGVALVGGNRDDLLDRRANDPHDSGQQIDLWGTAAGFPRVHCRLADIGKTGQVRDADAVLAAGRGEGLRIESAQHPPGHTRPAARFIVRKIHRGLHFPVNAAVITRCLSLESV